MKSKASQASEHRCVYQFADGRRCRMLRTSGHNSLCAFHAREEQQLLETEKLAAEFASLSGKYVTALDVNHVLGKVFDAFAHKQITSRTANTFGYLGQLLLQSVPQVQREINRATNNPNAHSEVVRTTIPYFRRKPQT